MSCGENRPRWLALLGLVLVVSACGGGGEEPKPDGLLIDPAHQSLSIAPGGEVSVHVKLERTGTLSGAILVTSSTGPTGVKAAPLVLTADESEGALLFQANELAEIGDKGRVLLLAQSGSEAYSATADVEVIAPVTVELPSVLPQVTQTQSAQVTVAIKRAGGFKGPVRLAVKDPPPGITVDPQELTLEPGTTSAAFTLRTNYMTPIAKSSLTFTATVSRFSASATTSMDVSRSTSTWDTSLGENGWLRMPQDTRSTSLAIQPDGRFVVATVGSNTNVPIYLRRFELDGNPDKTFGQQGIVELSGSTYASYTTPPKMAVQPDGKLLVLDSSDQQVFLYRLLPDGSLDTAFGNAGRTTLLLDRPADSVEMALLPDGAILLAARQYFQLECLRLSATGVVDTNYGASGRRLLPTLDARTYSPLGLFTDAQGRTLLVVNAFNEARNEMGLQVFRLTGAGAVDGTFGPDGQRTYLLSSAFRLKGLAWLGNGFAAVGYIAKDDLTPGFHRVVRLAQESDTLEVQWKSVDIPSATAHAVLTGLSDGRTLMSTNDGTYRLTADGAMDPGFQHDSFTAVHLFTAPGDAVYHLIFGTIRRMMPPR